MSDRADGRFPVPWLPVLLLLCAGCFLLSLWAGPYPLTPTEVFRALVGPSPSAVHEAVVLRVRLPRSVLAALVGAGLAAAGGGFQGVLRNPLADPYILGVSGGAALAAVLLLAFGGWSATAVPLAAFVGAFTALIVVHAVARSQRSSPHALILAGVMVGSFCSALLLGVLWTTPADPARAAIFWLAGDLSAADTTLLAVAVPWMLAAFLGLWVRSAALDLLTQGEATAEDLGLDVARARLWVFATAGGLTAAAVALAGLVGFVGLVVPHVVRILWGPRHRRLLPACALLGASFLLLSDAVARTVMVPAEVPVGVVTALVGAPFFLYLLRRRGVQG